MTLRVRASTWALGSVIICAACTTAPHEQPSPPPSPTTVELWSGVAADLRIRWTASPGIILESGPAVVVRAYTESYSLANIMGSRDFVYPGFDRAVPPDERDGTGPWPDVRSAQKEPLVGNLLTHIARISPTDAGFESVVCHWYFTAGVVSGGKVEPYTSSVQPALTRVTVATPLVNSHASAQLQEGPRPAPVSDVFGPARILARDYASEDVPAGEDWPSYGADRDVCLAAAPAPIERREFMVAGPHTRAEYPTLPAFPGWPEAGVE